jgi:hypothetical protein
LERPRDEPFNQHGGASPARTRQHPTERTYQNMPCCEGGDTRVGTHGTGDGVMISRMAVDSNLFFMRAPLSWLPRFSGDGPNVTSTAREILPQVVRALRLTSFYRRTL